MPFKSQAQKAKMAELVKQGKVKQATFDEFDSQTKGPLPERVTLKKPSPSSLVNSFKAPKAPEPPKFTSVDQLTKFRKNKFGE